ncbi:MAG: hypothetical protein K2G35_05025 [Duncaniella sp.]|nr:hypothetical protein [Duncaniella sp.]
MEIKNDGFETIRTATPLSAIPHNGIDAQGLVPVSHETPPAWDSPVTWDTSAYDAAKKLLLISNFDIPPR